MGMWFERLTGFLETSPDEVREQMFVEGATLTSRINGRSWQCGTLDVISLAELRGRVSDLPAGEGVTTVQEVIADVQDLHADADNENALFQVASQFNLLEMVSPGVPPEHGVGIYEHDFTQGPACAIAAGAGTIYRNYFVEVNGKIGQSENSQIDCLDGMGEILGNANRRLWEMRNGYTLTTEDGLREIGAKLRSASAEELDRLRGALKVGIQRDTQVTLPGANHNVSQVYCSALPVAYSHWPAGMWQEFAVLVLEAAYEATFCAAVLKAAHRGNNRLFLTLLGGGAFGNESDWIIGAIRRALDICRTPGLMSELSATGDRTHGFRA